MLRETLIKIREEARKLNETPIVIDDDDLPLDYIDDILIDPIRKHIKSDKFKYIGEYKLDSENVHIHRITIEWYEVIYVVSKEDKITHIDNIIGATLVKPVNLFGGSYIQPKMTKKFIYNYPAVTLLLYKIVYSNHNSPIITDDYQTRKMSKIWKKWISNKDKYEISTITLVPEDKTIKNIGDYAWGKDEKHKERLIALAFN